MCPPELPIELATIPSEGPVKEAVISKGQTSVCLHSPQSNKAEEITKAQPNCRLDVMSLQVITTWITSEWTGGRIDEPGVR